MKTGENHGGNQEIQKSEEKKLTLRDRIRQVADKVLKRGDEKTAQVLVEVHTEVAKAQEAVDQAQAHLETAEQNAAKVLQNIDKQTEQKTTAEVMTPVVLKAREKSESLYKQNPVGEAFAGFLNKFEDPSVRAILQDAIEAQIVKNLKMHSKRTDASYITDATILAEMSPNSILEIAGQFSGNFVIDLGPMTHLPAEMVKIRNVLNNGNSSLRKRVELVEPNLGSGGDVVIVFNQDALNDPNLSTISNPDSVKKIKAEVFPDKAAWVDYYASIPGKDQAEIDQNIRETSRQLETDYDSLLNTVLRMEIHFKSLNEGNIMDVLGCLASVGSTVLHEGGSQQLAVSPDISNAIFSILRKNFRGKESQLVSMATTKINGVDQSSRVYSQQMLGDAMTALAASGLDVSRYVGKEAIAKADAEKSAAAEKELPRNMRDMIVEIQKIQTDDPIEKAHLDKVVLELTNLHIANKDAIARGEEVKYMVVDGFISPNNGMKDGQPSAEAFRSVSSEFLVKLIEALGVKTESDEQKQLRIESGKAQNPAIIIANISTDKRNNPAMYENANVNIASQRADGLRAAGGATASIDFVYKSINLTFKPDFFKK